MILEIKIVVSLGGGGVTGRGLQGAFYGVDNDLVLGLGYWLRG